MWELNLCMLATLVLSEASSIRCNDIKIVNDQQTVCPCEYNFQPVCGSDGVTYTNKCLLDCYNNANKYTGYQPVTEVPDFSACSKCICQNINLPVCTLDGLTYSNECELSCENIKRVMEKRPLVYLAYRSTCIGPPCNCTTVAAPVCGTDNILYRNLCILKCTNTNAKLAGLPPIEFQNYGACLDGCQCPDIKQAVCGSDRVEYDNPCLLACQNRKMTCSTDAPITVANKQECRPCKCPKIFDPVCGSDDKSEHRTFQNICELNCEAKRQNNKYLRAIAFGACPKCLCTDDKQPVCGSDCNTYKNECELRCANDCRQKNDPPISIFHSGPCQLENCDCSHCPKEYVPMCGNDEQTYWNLCWLKCNSNCANNQNGKQIYLHARGSCSL